MYNIPWRVHQGIQFIEKELRYIEKWWEKIDLDTLVVEDARYCILGQLCGQCKIRFSPDQMADRGFDSYIKSEDMQIEYLQLNEEWKRQIILRRNDG